MATAEDVIAWEESHLGEDGSSTNTWYWDANNGWAWCCAFQQRAFAACGAQDLLQVVSAYCPTQMNAMRNAGLEIDGPQRGAVVFFDWDNDGEVDHIGMVRWDNGDGTFATVEGNSGDPGAVRFMTQGVNWGYSCYFFMPNYASTPISQPVPEPTGQTQSGAIRIHLQAMSQAGGILPEVVDDEDNAGDGTPIQLLAAWADGATLDAQADDLPKLSNPSDIGDAENGAIGDGTSITKLRLYLWSPNSDMCVKYRVKAAGQWYSWMIDDYDTGGSGDDFAGDGVNPITNVEAYAVPA